MIIFTDKNKYIFSITTNSDAGFIGNKMSVDLFFEDSIRSCNVETGFRPLNHKFFSDSALAIRTSQNVIDINGSIHGVYIRSNLVSKGTLDSQNGTLSNILARLPINVQSGSSFLEPSPSRPSRSCSRSACLCPCLCPCLCLSCSRSRSRSGTASSVQSHPLC